MRSVNAHNNFYSVQLHTFIALTTFTNCGLPKFRTQPFSPNNEELFFTGRVLHFYTFGPCID